MNTAADLSLYDALLLSGRFSPDQRVEAERLFAEHAADPVRLADALLAAKLITKYMHRKVQTGKAGELVFGQYLILERIGEGGMGKVYRAIETRMGREVALKTIRPNLLANRTVVQRYKREARAAAALDHPNIVKLFEADDVGGRYFLAMEFVDGSDLSRLIKDLNKERSPMPPAEAAEYIRQAALGLQHAHDKGLVHRDIKPSNLLVSGERAIPGTGGKAHVKILDMGLVRSLTDDDASNMDLTRDGTVVGTPDYMSPEQSRNSSTVDPRADIYSLGCTLYFLLRGAPPYDSGTAIDKLIKHQLDPVPDIRQYRPDVPPALAAVIKRMMAKRPDERFATSADVARELARFTGENVPDMSSLPALEAELAGIPALDAGPVSEPAPARGGYHVDFAPTTPAPAGGPPAQPVAVPPAQAMAGDSGLRSVARPVAKSSAATATGSGTRPAPSPSQRTVRVVTVQAKPIAKPPADATPSGDTATPPRSRKADDSGSNPSARRPGRKSPPPKKAKGVPVLLIVVVAGVVGVALIVVLAAIVALTGQNNGPTPTTAAKANAAPTTAAPPPLRSAFRPVAELLPDDTAAVLVADPKGYAALTPPDADTPNARRQADVLARFFRFDPRKFDRVTVAFHTDMTRCVAAGEGDVLKCETFRKELDRLPWVETETGPSGAVLVRNKRDTKANPFNADRRVRAALLPTPSAYLIGSDKADLADLYKNAATRKGPTGVDPLLLGHVAEAGKSADTPLVALAASGRCLLPLKPRGTPDPLSSFGVELFTVTATGVDDRTVRLTVRVLGPEGRRLSRFVEVELTAMLEAMLGRELASPLATPLTDACHAVQPTDAAGGRKQLTVSFTAPWSAVAPAADKLIGTPTDK